MKKIRWAVLLGLATGLQATASIPDKSLRMFHTHTKKSIEVTYFRNGRYDPEGLKSLNHFLADFRTGEAVDMDRRLFDILHLIQQQTGSSGTYEIISAYRSPETNEMLRARSSGVAKKSLHIKGQAMDVRLTDVDTGKQRDVARPLEMGGVGFYHKSNFIHVDVGRVRYW